MSKEARALLKRINDMKNEIRSLQAQGKTKDMQDKFTELKDLQAQFDILMEMEDDEEDEIRDSIRHGRTKNIDGADGEGK